MLEQILIAKVFNFGGICFNWVDMNRHEPFLPRGRQAKIRYLDADFQVLSEGDHVVCAVTGMPIKIEQLTYWSVARQEPYISAEAAFRRLLETEFT